MLGDHYDPMNKRLVLSQDNYYGNSIAAFGVAADRRAGAPGVYVGEAKIAALGIRVTRGRAWHGIALNVDMDLSPFLDIDPCGYPGLEVTQAKDLGIRPSALDLGLRLARLLEARLEHA